MSRRSTGARITQDKDRQELQVVQKEEDIPLPPAEELEKLKAIDPSLITTTIDMVKEEGASRRQRLNKVDWFVFIERILALLIVGAISAGAFWASYLLGMGGHEWPACVISGGTLAMIISAILKRK